jgi:hypothetical protein
VPTKKPVALNLRRMLEEKLLSSGISAKDGAAMKCDVRSADNAPSDIPIKEAGFIIPYFDIHGKPLKFWRYRYLIEPKPKGFAALTKRKPLKYVQPPKSEVRMYLPPILDWAALAKDSSETIIITEGELKAFSACANTPYACIGLGGVWSFKSNSRHEPVIPDFDAFKWEGRPVYIVYDSDAVTNPNVMMAENALARVLLSRGAEPHIVRLPALADGAKCGLDDYLVAHGAERLEDLLEKCETWRSAKELHKLNEEVVYVRDPGLILRLDNLQKLSPRAFVDHAFATRIYYEEVVVKKDVKLIPKSAPKEWITWPSRAEVPKMSYEPGQERIDTEGNLNLWPGWGCEPVPGDVSLWTELLDHLFSDSGDAGAREWFERWCAYPIQHPGTKMFSSAVLWGLAHGTGKSFVGYSLFKIYGDNAVEIADEDLRGSFNDWAENRQFVMGEEITGGDKRGQGDRMKGMITRQKVRINAKFVPAYSVRDCLNYLFTSNHPDSFFLEDEDRRYFIHEVRAKPKPAAFYKRYEDWIGRAGTVGPGASALFHHLLTLPLGDFNPSGPAFLTAAKENMLSLGRSDLATWVYTLKHDPDSVLKLDKMPLKWSLLRVEELLSLYDPENKGRVTGNGMARELSRQGFRKVAGGIGVRTLAGLVRLWAVRDVDALTRATPGEIADTYNRERGLVKKRSSSSEQEKAKQGTKPVRDPGRASQKHRG